MQALTDLTAPDLAAVDSPEGRAWMAAVPSLLHDLARQRNLNIAGDLFWHGCNAVVFPVRQGRRPLALKLAWPVDQTRGEADALTEWRGRGIVELVAADVPRGALLLGRLDALRSLVGIPLAKAATIAGTLAETLAVEASGSFPSVRAEARQLTKADLLWSRADELPDAQAITGLLGIIVENGNLNQAKAIAWGFVRTIDYWLWGLENGFTVDPARCQRIASALAPLARHGSQP